MTEKARGLAVLPESGEAPVAWAVEDGVAVVVLDRPDRRNAFNPAMRRELHAALVAADRDEAVRAIVVTGRGDHFCVGADLQANASHWTNRPAAEEAALGAVLGDPEPWQLNTPVIAAMNGAAAGVGVTLALTFDVRVVAEDATLALGFTRRGVMPEAHSLWLASRLVGLGRCMDLLLSGRSFTGREAYDRGLATIVTPRDDVLSTSLHIAHDIATHTAPASVALTKRLAWDLLEESDRERAGAVEAAAFRWTTRQPDAAEGVNAFIERREPRWTGSKRDYWADPQVS